MTVILVLVAHNGRTLAIEAHPHTRVDLVQDALVTLSGITKADQIVICQGARLDPVKPLAAYKLPVGESHSPEDQPVFLYNKAYLRPGSSLPVEDPPEPINVQVPTLAPVPMQHPLQSAPSPLVRALPDYERQFEHHLKEAKAYWEASQARLQQARELLSQQEVQARAADAARANVEAHYTYILGQYREFCQRYATQHAQHSSLLSRYLEELDSLRCVVLPASVRSSQWQRLVDLMDLSKLQASYSSAAKMHEGLVPKVTEQEALFGSMQRGVEALLLQVPRVNLDGLGKELTKQEGLLDQQGTIVQTLTSDLKRVKGVVEECVQLLASHALTPASIHDTLGAMEAVHDNHERLLLPRMRECDGEAAAFGRRCGEAKQLMTLDVVEQLQRISEQQSRIREMKTRLAAFTRLLGSKEEAFGQLRPMQRLMPAYRCCMAECVRRKAWGEECARHAATLAEHMARFRDKEVARRSAFRQQVDRYMPAEVLRRMGLVADPPHCQVTTGALDPDLLLPTQAELEAALGAQTAREALQLLPEQQPPGSPTAGEEGEGEGDGHGGGKAGGGGALSASGPAAHKELELARLRAKLASHVALSFINQLQQPPAAGPAAAAAGGGGGSGLAAGSMQSSQATQGAAAAAAAAAATGSSTASLSGLAAAGTAASVEGASSGPAASDLGRSAASSQLGGAGSLSASKLAAGLPAGTQEAAAQVMKQALQAKDELAAGLQQQLDQATQRGSAYAKRIAQLEALLQSMTQQQQRSAGSTQPPASQSQQQPSASQQQQQRHTASGAGAGQAGASEVAEGAAGTTPAAAQASLPAAAQVAGMATGPAAGAAVAAVEDVATSPGALTSAHTVSPLPPAAAAASQPSPSSSQGGGSQGGGAGQPAVELTLATSGESLPAAAAAPSGSPSPATPAAGSSHTGSSGGSAASGGADSRAAGQPPRNPGAAGSTAFEASAGQAGEGAAPGQPAQRSSAAAWAADVPLPPAAGLAAMQAQAPAAGEPQPRQPAEPAGQSAPPAADSSLAPAARASSPAGLAGSPSQGPIPAEPQSAGVGPVGGTGKAAGPAAQPSAAPAPAGPRSPGPGAPSSAAGPTPALVPVPTPALAPGAEPHPGNPFFLARPQNQAHDVSAGTAAAAAARRHRQPSSAGGSSSDGEAFATPKGGASMFTTASAWSGSGSMSSDGAAAELLVTPRAGSGGSGGGGSGGGGSGGGAAVPGQLPAPAAAGPVAEAVLLLPAALQHAQQRLGQVLAPPGGSGGTTATVSPADKVVVLPLPPDGALLGESRLGGQSESQSLGSSSGLGLSGSASSRQGPDATVDLSGVAAGVAAAAAAAGPSISLEAWRPGSPHLHQMTSIGAHTSGGSSGESSPTSRANTPRTAAVAALPGQSGEGGRGGQGEEGGSGGSGSSTQAATSHPAPSGAETGMGASTPASPAGVPFPGPSAAPKPPSSQPQPDTLAAAAAAAGGARPASGPAAQPPPRRQPLQPPRSQGVFPLLEDFLPVGGLLTLQDSEGPASEDDDSAASVVSGRPGAASWEWNHARMLATVGGGEELVGVGGIGGVASLGPASSATSSGKGSAIYLQHPTEQLGWNALVELVMPKADYGEEYEEEEEEEEQEGEGDGRGKSTDRTSRLSLSSMSALEPDLDSPGMLGMAASSALLAADTPTPAAPAGTPAAAASDPSPAGAAAVAAARRSWISVAIPPPVFPSLEELLPEAAYAALVRSSPTASSDSSSAHSHSSTGMSDLDEKAVGVGGASVGVAAGAAGEGGPSQGGHGEGVQGQQQAGSASALSLLSSSLHFFFGYPHEP